MNLREHWQKIYQSKATNQLSWYQARPETSLQFFNELKVPKNAAIIDIGAGDGNLVDHLLEAGYTNITVLDISSAALEKTKKRLGNKAAGVKWIEGDVLSFNPQTQYELWHDRAVLHFLNSDEEIETYFRIADKSLSANGKMITATFSEAGPEKCSGLAVHRYSQQSLVDKARHFFEKIKCIKALHQTPFNTMQEFLFCSFLKLKHNH